MTVRRALLVVALVAAAVYVLTLWNGFAGDDGQIIVNNPMVHGWAGIGPAVFRSPYWPPRFGGALYRPLATLTYTVDWHWGGGAPAWFHAVNLLWNAGVSVLVALLAAAWIGRGDEGRAERAALVAGLLFAVHPVHVEAVANVVGRAELMAACFTLLAVYLAVERGNWWLSALAWLLGLFSKENAVVAPALIAAAWLLGVGAWRPTRGRVIAFAGAWLGVGLGYAGLRHLALGSYAPLWTPAPVFVGQNALTVRLTAIAALGDVARLLFFPLHLRVDYSPGERTAVTSVADPAFLAGLLLLVSWGVLLWKARRAGRNVEALGLAWIGIAFLPVANLLFPIGVLVAERTLYLPSVGLALGAGAVMARLPARPGYGLALGLVVAAGATRSVLRIPVWHDNLAMAQSIRRDSPDSYQGQMDAAGILLERGRPDLALTAARRAIETYALDPRPYLIGAHAAFRLGAWGVADSLLEAADTHCRPCGGVYGAEVREARALGDSAAGDSISAHFRRVFGGEPF